MANSQGKRVQQRFDPSQGKPLFSWEAPEFVKYKKTATWFIMIFVVGICLGIIFGIQKQWSSVAVVAAALIVFTTLSGAKPRKISCSLHQDGIVVDGKVYGFNQFKSFWLEAGDLAKAKLQLLGRFAGVVSMPILGIDPEQVRLFLGKHLPEEENKGPDLVDEINRILRF